MAFTYCEIKINNEYTDDTETRQEEYKAEAGIINTPDKSVYLNNIIFTQL